MRLLQRRILNSKVPSCLQAKVHNSICSMFVSQLFVVKLLGKTGCSKARTAASSYSVFTDVENGLELGVITSWDVLLRRLDL